MWAIMYFIYLAILFLCLFALRTAKVRAASWQYFVIIFGIAGAYVCGYYMCFIK